MLSLSHKILAQFDAFQRPNWLRSVDEVSSCIYDDDLTVMITGKTLLAKTLAKVLDVPFSVSDATSFTQVRLSQGAASVNAYM